MLATNAPTAQAQIATDDQFETFLTGVCTSNRVNFSAEVTLYYQSTSKEYVEFLRDENFTNTKGQDLYDLWNNNGKCPPEMMQTASLTLNTAVACCLADESCIDVLSDECLAQGGQPQTAGSVCLGDADGALSMRGLRVMRAP